jgi:hypothetical protein
MLHQGFARAAKARKSMVKTLYLFCERKESLEVPLSD